MPALYGIIIGFMIAVGITGLYPEYTNLYKQGQIDALNGKVLFELKTKPDGTIRWERKITP